jgi:hypothetical protein
MKRICAVCGDEYEALPFGLDEGCCLTHVNKFWSKPLWFVPCQAGTRSLWQLLAIVHFISIGFIAVLLPTEVSLVVAVYCLAMALYFPVRLLIGQFTGLPVLTLWQAIVCALLPLWGPVLFVALLALGQRLRYGH